MRINRATSRLSFRRRRRRSGCLSTLMMLIILGGVGVLTWRIIERRWSAPAAFPSGDSPSARLDAAQRLFDAGDLDGAVERLRGGAAGARGSDGSTTRLLARALVYRSYSDYDRAIDRDIAVQITTDAARQRPNDADTLAAHAFALQAVGRTREAADVAARVLESNPSHAFARTALALAYGGAGAHEAALRESLRAAQTATTADALDVLRAVAIGRADTGDYGEALRVVDQAVRAHPSIMALYFERALYALQLGDADTATVAYYDVLARQPDNVKARLRLCELSSTMREYEAALQHCTEVTERAPAWAEGWYQLGRENFLQGDFAAARDHLHRCSSLQVLQNVPIAERRFECWYLQGQAAQILGDCPALLATYNEFRAMAADDTIHQTWTMPPEGPPGCTPE
ncbi:MAG: tetratricopeptide repeat protein [Chloroflexota bacterium]|nr:tetratricopeptide repeat protein [Chloroflexota bacterium]